MANLKITKVNDDIERKIVTGLIVSTRFCQKVKPMYKPEFLQVDYARRVAGWCLSYFKDYQKAPDDVIQDMFDMKRGELSEAEAEIIEMFLGSISEEYLEKKFNIPYVFYKTKKYFEKRASEEFFREGYQLIRVGEYEKAEELRQQFKTVMKETNERFRPFDTKEMKLFDVNDDENRLFRMPGVLGEFLGYFHRNWLLSVMAPEKGTKSFWLGEIAYQGVKAGLVVVWYSLEMNKETLKNRVYRRVARQPHWNQERFREPVFDCIKNQDGSCRKKRENWRRKNKGGNIKLLDDGEKPEFSEKMKYKACSKCRGTTEFETEYWFRMRKKNRLVTKTVLREGRKFRKKYGNNLYIRPFPAFSVNFDGLLEDLGDLENSDGVIADVVIVDYFDILARETGIFSERDAINTTWKRGKNLADVKNCLVVTADQSVKKSRSKERLGVQDTSEDKRKDAHVDMKIAINQTEEEEADGVCRIGKIYHRHTAINKAQQVLVLQQLDYAMPLKDSEWFPGIPEMRKVK